MKLIIDIPEETYNEVCWRELFLCPRDRDNLTQAIKKAVPLDTIKSEIDEEMCLTDNPYTRETKYTIERLKLFKILNNIGKDCRDCKKWKDCPCGSNGHKNGTSQGYSIGECKDYVPQAESEDKE